MYQHGDTLHVTAEAGTACPTIGGGSVIDSADVRADMRGTIAGYYGITDMTTDIKVGDKVRWVRPEHDEWKTGKLEKGTVYHVSQDKDDWFRIEEIKNKGSCPSIFHKDIFDKVNEQPEWRDIKPDDRPYVGMEIRMKRGLQDAPAGDVYRLYENRYGCLAFKDDDDYPREIYTQRKGWSHHMDYMQIRNK